MFDTTLYPIQVCIVNEGGRNNLGVTVTDEIATDGIAPDEVATTEPPARRSREHTRARLLAAAADVFAEVGLEGASVEAITERAGFTRGAFYSNFGSKDELFLDLAVHVADEKLARARAQVAHLQGTIAGTGLADALASVLDTVRDDPAGVALMAEIRITALRDDAVAERYLSWQAGLLESVDQLVSEIVGGAGLRLRIPSGDAARLLMEVFDDAAGYAAMARLTTAEADAHLNARIGVLLQALIENP